MTVFSTLATCSWVETLEKPSIAVRTTTFPSFSAKSPSSSAAAAIISMCVFFSCPLPVPPFPHSNPDEHGFCTLGASIDCTRAAAECADVVVAEINAQMPRCYGDSLIHMSHLDKVVYVDRPIPKYVLPGGHGAMC